MPSVLVVDDHIDNCRPLVRLLKVMGHKAAWVTSGPEALDFIRREQTKMVILDVMMPGMDGFEVLRAVRAEPQFDALPVVMFSAVDDPTRVDEAKQLGAQDYLVKGGTNFDTLREMVEKYVGPAN